MKEAKKREEVEALEAKAAEEARKEQEILKNKEDRERKMLQWVSEFDKKKYLFGEEYNRISRVGTKFTTLYVDHFLNSRPTYFILYSKLLLLLLVSEIPQRETKLKVNVLLTTTRHNDISRGNLICISQRKNRSI